MKSDLKKPTAFQLNSKKDRKVMNKKVKLTQTTPEGSGEVPTFYGPQPPIRHFTH